VGILPLSGGSTQTHGQDARATAGGPPGRKVAWASCPCPRARPKPTGKMPVPQRTGRQGRQSGMGILPMSDGRTQTHGQDARATAGGPLGLRSGMGILPMSEGRTQTHGQDARATADRPPGAAKWHKHLAHVRGLDPNSRARCPCHGGRATADDTHCRSKKKLPRGEAGEPEKNPAGGKPPTMITDRSSPAGRIPAGQ
jgi:hypothetical protein